MFVHIDAKAAHGHTQALVDFYLLDSEAKLVDFYPFRRWNKTNKHNWICKIIGMCLICFSHSHAKAASLTKNTIIVSHTTLYHIHENTRQYQSSIVQYNSQVLQYDTISNETLCMVCSWLDVWPCTILIDWSQSVFIANHYMVWYEYYHKLISLIIFYDYST